MNTGWLDWGLFLLGAVAILAIVLSTFEDDYDPDAEDWGED